MTILYFTATGNSLAVAKKLGGELVSIPQSIKNGQYENTDDVMVLYSPPTVVIRRKLSVIF